MGCSPSWTRRTREPVHPSPAWSPSRPQASGEGLLSARKNIEAIYPLTPMQQGVLFHALSAPDSALYVGQLSCALHGPFDADAFEEAWQRLVARESVLRTSFVWKRVPEPRQVVHRVVSLDIERLDWSDLDEDERAAKLEDFLASDRERGLSLSKPPLTRVTLIRAGDELWHMVWTMHHLLIDGWCLQLAMRQLFALYEGLRAGEEPRLPAARPFVEYIQWLKRQDVRAAEDHWRHALEGFDTTTPLPLDERGEGTELGEAAEQPEHTSMQLNLSKELTERLLSLSRESRLTPGSLLQGAWAVLLGRYGGLDDVAFGAVVSGRPADLPGADSMIGLFINTLPARFRLEPGRPFLDWLREAQEQQAASRQFEFTPLVQAREWSDLPAGAPLFESILVFDNYPAEELTKTEVAGLRIADPRMADQANYPCSVSAALWRDELCLRLSYERGRFASTSIERLLSDLRALLERVLDRPDASVVEVSSAIGSPCAPGGTGATVATSAAPVPGSSACEELLAELRGAVTNDTRFAAVDWSTAELIVLDTFGQPAPAGGWGDLAVRSDAGVVRIGEWGRLWPDGRLDRDECAGPAVWLGEQRVWLPGIEELARRTGGIEDCVALARRSANGALRVVLFVVAARVARDPADRELEQTLLQALPSALREQVRVMCVHRIPTTASGRVDRSALERVPVLGPELLSDLEGELSGDETCVTAEDYTDATALAHLADVLPITDKAARGASAPAASSPAAADVDPNAGPSTTGVPPIPNDPSWSRTLPEVLRATARRSERGVRFVRSDGTESVWSYAELLERGSKIAGALRSLGMEPGAAVLMQLEENDDFLSIFWGCQLAGIRAVPLAVPADYAEPSPARDKLLHAWKLLGEPLVIASSSEQKARMEAFAAGAKLATFRCEASAELPLSELEEEYRAPTEDVALLLFTSGSTGAPKAVQLTHENVLAMCRNAAHKHGFTEDDVTLNWLPLDHVGGIVMCHTGAIVTAGAQVHVATSRVLADPLLWLDLVDRHRVTFTWAPNFAFGLVNGLLSGGEDPRGTNRPRWDLSSLGFIVNGGEAVVVRTARRFLQLLGPFGLPATAMRPTWGMSETSSGTIYSARFTLETTSDDDRFAEVGEPIPGLLLRIVDEDDNVVREGTVGGLQARGPVVTSGYFENEEANREAFTDDGWFRTGDLGTLVDGQLTLTGRDKDVIIVHGQNLASHEVESAVEEVEGVAVSYTAACAVNTPGKDTDLLAVFFVAEEDDPANLAGQPPLAVMERVREQAVRRLGLKPDFLVPMRKEEIPKTEIGKIQRAQLRTAFESGELDEIVKRIDLASDNERTIPEWFYERVWRRRQRRAEGEASASGGTTLLFADALGLADELKDELERAGEDVVVVRAADGFTSTEERAFELSPGSEEHYDELLRALASSGRSVRRIVHMWTYDHAPSASEAFSASTVLARQTRGSVGLLGLLKAVERLPEDARQALDLLVVSKGVHAIGARPAENWAHASLLGLVYTANQELADVSVRLMDLDTGSSAGDLAALLGELPYGVPEVAYRSDGRFVPTIEALDLGPDTLRPSPLADDRLYVVTGGLGGIGVEVGRWLLANHAARLVVIGRRSIDTDRAARGAFGRLEDAARETGGEVVYEAIDVTDADALSAATRKHCERFGVALGGVFHLAGEFHEGLLTQEDAASLQKALRPKLAGALALAGLVEASPDAVLVLFGSLNGAFGGVSVGAYSAASSSLDGFANALGARLPGRVHCLHWSMWPGVGMSTEIGSTELSVAKGYAAIGVERGLQALRVALAHASGPVLIGIDSSSPHMARRIGGGPLAATRPIAFAAHGGQGARPGLEAIGAIDEFGVRQDCAVVTVPELLRSGDGSVDLSRMVREHRLQGRGARGLARGLARQPASEAERKLAAIWCDVLKRPAVGVDDDFFELGGDSILAIQVASRAAQAGLDLAPELLFKHTTIAELAAVAGAAVDSTVDQGPVTGGVPLLPIQEWFFGQSYVEPRHSNMHVLLSVKEPLQEELLCKAVETLVAHHDALRARFVEVDGRWEMSIAEVENPLPADVVQVVSLDGAGDSAGIIEQRADELQASLDLRAGPLLRVALFRGAGGEGDRLLIVIHHLVVDGVSWRILLEDLMLGLEQLRRGEAVALPPKTHSVRDWGERLRERAQSAELAKEVPYWTATVETPAARLPVDSPPEPASGSLRETNTAGAADSVVVSLDAETTQSLLEELPPVYRTRIEDVLLTALAQAVGEWTGGARIAIDLEGHGREPLPRSGNEAGLDITRTVGWFTSLYPVALTIPKGGDPGLALRSIKEQVRSVPGKGVGYGLLRYVARHPALQGHAAPELSFNYLGRFDQVVSESAPMDFATESGGRAEADSAQRSHLIDVAGGVRGGALELAFRYCSELHHRSTIESLSASFLRALHGIIAHCRVSEGGRTPSDYPLVKLTQAEVDRIAGDGRSVSDIYPLLPIQAGILFHSLSSTDTDPYFVQFSATLEAPGLDTDAFREAWQHVVQRHDILRTGFVWEETDEPVQVVRTSAELPWHAEDWRAFDENEQRARVERLLASDRATPLELNRSPVMRVSLARLTDDLWQLVWSYHHLLLDGWSGNILIGDVLAAYEALVDGGEVSLPPAPRYRDYIAWVLEEDVQAQEEFWRTELEGFTTPTPLMTQGSAARDVSHGVEQVDVPPSLAAALEGLTREHKLTLNTILHGVWALLLGLRSGQREVVFGSTASGRSGNVPGVDAMVGVFMNSLPVRVDLRPSTDVVSWLEAIQEHLARLRSFETTPLNRIQGISEVGGEALFKTLVVFENYPLGEALEGGERRIRLRANEAVAGTNYPLTLAAEPFGGLTLLLSFDRTEVSDDDAREILGQLLELLEAVASQPRARLEQLSLAGAMQSEPEPASSSQETADAVDEPKLVKIGSVWIEPETISALVLESGNAQDCVTLARRVTDGAEWLVAYVVSTNERYEAAVKAKLEDELPPQVCERIRIVPVARLPLDAAGQLDTEALLSVPAADEKSAVAIESCLKSSTTEVVVVHTEEPSPAGRLDVGDLLEDNGGSGSTVASSAPSTVPGTERGSSASAALLARQPSIASGGDVDPEPGVPATFAGALQRAAAVSPTKGLQYIGGRDGDTAQSYPELLADAAHGLAGLRRLGLKAGDRVLFQVPDNRDFVTLFWSCQLGGMVPVPVSLPPTYDQPGAARDKVRLAWELLGEPWILIGDEQFDDFERWRESDVGEAMRAAAFSSVIGKESTADWHQSEPGDVALILLTSGSTGVPKGVQLTHTNVLAMCCNAAHKHGFTEDRVTLNWLPLDHVGCIVMCHTGAVVSASSQVQVATDRVLADPLLWLDLVDRHRVTFTWAPNFAFGLVNDLLSGGEDPREGSRPRWDLSSLGFIVNGGEAVVVRTARRFLRLLGPYGLPATAMRPTWGMSETSSGTIYSSRFTLEATSDEDRFAEVGEPIPGLELRIVDEDNNVVPEGTVGSLHARGPMVTSGYVENEEANREAFTDDGWFRTGDLGTLVDGQLTLTGRDKDVIIVHGQNLASHEVESAVEEVEGVAVSYTAGCAVRSPGGDTDELAVFFVPEETRDELPLALMERIRAQVVRQLGLKPDYLIPVRREQVPKTEIGKIQRSQLVQAFESGAFDDVVKEVNLATGGAGTVPEWFYERVWKRKEYLVPQRADLERGTTLILEHGRGLGARLREELERAGESVVTVAAGRGLGGPEAGRLTVDPEVPSHYDELFDVLSHVVPTGHAVRRVVYLLSQDDAEDSADEAGELERAERDVLGLLSLVQALHRCAPAETKGETNAFEAIEIVVVCRNVQRVWRSDPVRWQWSSIIGLVHTIPLELPWASCRLIDLDRAPPEESVVALRRELQSALSERQVAYRRGGRLVARLRPVGGARVSPAPSGLRVGAFYVVAGGLGGVGAKLAAHLLAEHGAHVLLLGRTPVPDEAEWAVEVGRGGAVAERIRSLLALDSFSGRFAYEAVDVRDEAVVRRVVEAWKTTFGLPLECVFHLAATLEERLITEEKLDAFRNGLHEKGLGLASLHAVASSEPSCRLVVFGSVNGLFGAANMSAYAAANSLVEGFVEAHRTPGTNRVQALHWSQWLGLGLSRGYGTADAGRSKGYLPIGLDEGMLSLEACLAQRWASVAIGLDGGSRQLGARLGDGDPVVRRTVAFEVVRDASADESLPSEEHELNVHDDFGVPVPWDRVRLEEFPRTEDGEVDREALRRSTDALRLGRADHVAPRNEKEQKLATILEDVLQVSGIGIHDNFFELGGDSILAIQVLSRATQAGIPISTTAIFQHPTIASLVEATGEETAVVAEQGPVTGDVALNPIQRWFFGLELDHPQHFNMPLMLATPENIDERLLQVAVRHVVRHHDALRSRFERLSEDSEEGSWKQWIDDPDSAADPRIFEGHDLRGLDQVAQKEEVARVAAGLQAGIDLAVGPLVRVAFFDFGPGARSRLLLVVHHLVVDGVSWRILLADLLQAYEQIAAGEMVALPAKTTSIQAWAARLPELAASPELAAEAESWARLGEQPITELPLDRDGTNHAGDVEIVSVSLSSDETKALVQDVVAAYEVEITDVLLAATGVALARWTSGGTFLIDLESHGRDTLFDDVDLSRTVGWFTALAPVSLEVGTDDALPEVLDRAKAARATGANHGLGHGLLRYMHPDADVREKLARIPGAQISLNYLGQFDQLRAEGERGGWSSSKDDSGPAHGPSDVRPHILDIGGSLIDGELQFEWIYGPRLHDRETVERVAAGFCEVLRAMIAAAGQGDASGFGADSLDADALDRLASQVEFESE